MTNFDFLKSDPQFTTFADTAVQAEQVLPISPAFSATGCRTAMEFAVKWLYSVDKSLAMPYEQTLVALTGSEDFRDLLPPGLFPKLNYIRKAGNNAAHNQKVSQKTKRRWRWRICTTLWVSSAVVMVLNMRKLHLIKHC